MSSSPLGTSFLESPTTGGTGVREVDVGVEASVATMPRVRKVGGVTMVVVVSSFPACSYAGFDCFVAAKSELITQFTRAFLL